MPMIREEDHPEMKREPGRLMTEPENLESETLTVLEAALQRVQKEDFDRALHQIEISLGELQALEVNLAVWNRTWKSTHAENEAST